MENKFLDICLKRLRVIPHAFYDDITKTKKMTFLTELAGLGYSIENPEMYNDGVFYHNYKNIIKILKEMRGGNVDYVPLFSNFPDETPKDNEHFTKRILGYIGNLIGLFNEGEQMDDGTFVPKWLFDLDDFGGNPITGLQDKGLFDKVVTDQSKKSGDTHTEWIKLKIVSQKEAIELVTNWCLDNLYSKSSIKEAIRPEINWVLDDIMNLDAIDMNKVVFKEIKSMVLKKIWFRGDITKANINNPTDLLRLFAELTDSDVSLSEKIKFPKFSRSQRRSVLSILDKCKDFSSFAKYKGLWLEIGRYIHPGEKKNKNKYKNVFNAFDMLRNKKFRTANSYIEDAIKRRDIPELLELLKNKPGVFARKIHHILEISSGSEETVLDSFSKIANKIELKNLLILRSYFLTINGDDKRAVINKKGKIMVLDNKIDRVSESYIVSLLKVLNKAIVDKMCEKESWDGKKVWIDKSLLKYTIPLQQRKSSDGLLTLGRGTRIPVDMSKVLRLFVYWKEAKRTTDLDLSCISFDEDMKYKGHVSYTNLKSGGIIHSGDLLSAPHGAVEYIDIPLQDASLLLKDGHRYISSQILVYSGDNFSNLDISNGGWMIRDKCSNDRKTFDIKTVQNKFEIRGKGKYAFPVLLDLKTGELIYVDLYVQNIDSNGGTHTNVEGTYNDVANIASQMVRMGKTKPNLYTLGAYNAIGRDAEMVDEKKDADITFGIENCSYNVRDIEKILSELI